MNYQILQEAIVHEISNPIFWEKYCKMLSAEKFTQLAKH